MFNNKKGALDVSINAIVVIIFAITMLSLGLVFMKGAFSKIGTQVDVAISGTELEKKPTPEDPFVLSGAQFEIKRGKSSSLQVGYYNGGTETEAVDLEVICNPGITVTPADFDPRPVDAGETLGWRASLAVTSGTPSDTYACFARTYVNNVEQNYADFFVVVP